MFVIKYTHPNIWYSIKRHYHLENAYEYYVNERIEEKFENYFI
jgi:hypothetical protein